MKPVDETVTGRIRTRAAELRARAKRVAERADEVRSRHESVDAVYVVVDRDSEIGGGIMAGSLAYRLFIWLLPFSLVMIGGIGFAAEVGSESPANAVKSLGLHGIVSHSVAEAAQGSSRWYALLIGVPILIWATRSLLKALIVVHRLVWGDGRRAAPKATIGATLRLLVLLVAYFVVLEFGRAVESWSGTEALRVLISTVGFFGWWLLVSLRLPHRDTPWHALVPGAILVAAGLELIALLITYLLAPQVDDRVGTYGALGVAAFLLFGLYLITRLVVAAAILNVTIWDRRNPSARA